MRALSKQPAWLCLAPTEAHGRDKALDLREETHLQSPNPWPECDTAQAPWTGEERRALRQGKVTRRSPLQDHLGSTTMEHSNSEESQEGQTFIMANMSKPTIKEGNERHLLNLNFNNPVLYSRRLLRHRYYYTPGMYTLFIPLCEFSALCFPYKNLK